MVHYELQEMDLFTDVCGQAPAGGCAEMPSQCRKVSRSRNLSSLATHLASLTQDDEKKFPICLATRYSAGNEQVHVEF